MAYPTYDVMDTEKVAQVFGLTGGELNDRPLRFAYRSERIDTGTWRHVPCFARGWARYWYDGAPEWAEEHGYDSGRCGWRGSWRTLVWDSGSYGDHVPPLTMIDVNGRRWRKVNTYRNSGETACPVPENHPGKVTRGEAVLQPPNPWRRDRPKARHAECPMCEARIGEEHGYLYLGDGWIEAVYYSPDCEEN